MLRFTGTLLHIDLILDIGKTAGEIAGEVEIEVIKARAHAMAIHTQGAICIHIDAIKELLLNLGDADDGFDVVFNENLLNELAVKILGIHIIFLSCFTPIYKQERPKLNKNSGRKNFGGFPVLFKLLEFELCHSQQYLVVFDLLLIVFLLDFPDILECFGGTDG